MILLAAYNTAISNSRPLVFVPSPNGDVVAAKSYDDTAEFYNLSIIFPKILLFHTKNILSAEDHQRVFGADGAMFSWPDDKHLIIGWPSEHERVKGPNNINNVHISYITYQPDLDQEHPKERYQKQLQNISYQFEETGKDPQNKRCIIHITGKDGEYYDHVAINFIGIGTDTPSNPYHGFGAIRLKFILSPLPHSKLSSLTLTQAKFATVFPQDEKTALPLQDGLSLDYGTYNRNEALKIFSYMKQGHFDIKLGQNFGQRHIDYKFLGKINPSIIDKFNICSSKTTIYGAPFSLPKY